MAVGFLGIRRFLSNSPVHRASELLVPGYGPLKSDPENQLDLPEGFEYQIISRAGETMADGLEVPILPDGMAAFPGPNGLTLVVRNHEILSGRGAFGLFNKKLQQVDASRIYDHGTEQDPAPGGTTTLVYDTANKKLVRQFASLLGTRRNCAGGPTPWGSWISCEETVTRKGEVDGGAMSAMDHGYNFEVPATAEPALADPVPLRAMGRFNHEAVAVDPKTGIVYQTEDRPDGLIYRFIPKRPGHLRDGGRLQALAIRDVESADTRNYRSRAIRVGRPQATSWIDLEDIQAPEDDLRLRGYEAGAARFSRGEGMWEGAGKIYFACTNGGRARKGQVWTYTPGEGEGTNEEKPGALELFAEPNDGNIVENADNLTIAPWGDVILCEDRQEDVVRLIGVTPEGRFYVFANSHLETEFAGATFSPDGSTLFVNSQGVGLTFAITGPWKA